MTSREKAFVIDGKSKYPNAPSAPYCFGEGGALFSSYLSTNGKRELNFLKGMFQRKPDRREIEKGLKSKMLKSDSPIH